MSTSQPASPDVFPSYESYREAGHPIRTSRSILRLVWKFQGPLTIAISVMSSEGDFDGPREPYFRQTLDGTSWHPVGQEPLTEPAVSSITVRADPLDGWEDDWLEAHRHACPGEKGCVYGDLEEGHDSYDMKGPYLIHCCDTSRPKNTAPLVVTASEKPYVTIHDYLAAVHPWLIGLRDKIISAMNTLASQPFSTEMELVVNYDGLTSLDFEHEEEWIRRAKAVRNLRFDNMADPLPDYPLWIGQPPDWWTEFQLQR